MRPALILSLFLVLPQLRAEEGFIDLFNGRDLAGWVNVNCAEGTWSVTNGMIHCTGAPIGELRTTRMYQNFVLELEWRHLQPKGNAGVFVWADALTARGQPFIRGIEVQVLDGLEGPGYTSDGDIFPIHGARMTPINGRGGSRAFPTEKRSRPSPEWNHYRIECVDGAISLAVNGKVVTRGHSASPRKGYICLESEGSPVQFRNIRLKELPAGDALSPDQIATPADGFRVLYSGVDLAGWNKEPAGAETWKVDDWNLTWEGAEAGAVLWSEQEYGDGVLIFDWRWTMEGKTGDWTRLAQLRGKDVSEALAKLDAKAAFEGTDSRGWNRAVLTLRGNEVSVELNGHDIGRTRLEGVPPAGRIGLVPPAAPVALANLYWKRLD